jgi:acyl-CoA synthetase (NDP forming)
LQVRADLDQFFKPDGVAILGRVDPDADPGALRKQHRERYCERFYLVNPRGGTVGDIPVYKTVLDIPDPVGLAVINIGPTYVAEALEQCAEKDIGYALVFTAGFGETGPEGAALERELADVVARTGLRVFGPNTNTNAFERMPEIPNLRGGKIGLLTQSGHNGRPVVQGAIFGVGFSRWVPTGNEVDLEMSDFLEYFAYDDDTRVIAGYIEGFKDPRKLRDALRAANDNHKPVVMLKIGSTDAGSKMASSHTGHLTGSDSLVDGLFAQHGVTRVRDLDELLETAALFAKLPEGTGPRVCHYSISGGSGTLMAEVAESFGVVAPPLSSETEEALHEYLPYYLSVSNPVDNGGMFLYAAPQAHRVRVLELIAADPNIDVIVIGITGALGPMTDNFGADILEFAPRSPKPVVVTWNSYKTDEQGFTDVIASGVTTFRSFRNCYGALRAFNLYQERRRAFRVRPSLPDRLSALQESLLAAGGTLSAEASRELLEVSGISVAREHVARSADEARRVAQALGPSVVMKIASADFPHKSDVGLVRIGVDAADADAIYEQLDDRARSINPSACIDGVLVQEQVTDGVEMIVGVTCDPVLGSAAMVGSGGVFAEVVRDVAVRPLPLDAGDAEEMVRGLRVFPLLDGARGRPKADLGALVETIMAVARLASAAGPRLVELDLNPVLARPGAATVVDSLVIAVARPDAMPPS